MARVVENGWMDGAAKSNCETCNNGISDRFLAPGAGSCFTGGLQRYNGAGASVVLGTSACACLDS